MRVKLEPSTDCSVFVPARQRVTLCALARLRITGFAVPIVITLPDATAFAFLVGRIYSLTMLFNLNTRKHGWRSGHSDTDMYTSGGLREASISLPGIRNSSQARRRNWCRCLDSEFQQTVDIDEGTPQSDGVRVTFSHFIFTILIFSKVTTEDQNNGRRSQTVA